MKKLFALSLAALLTLSMLAGCNTPAAPASTPDSSAPADTSEPASKPDTVPADEKPTVTFYHGYFQDEATWAPASEMRKLYQQFADLHKDEYTFEAVALDTGNQGVYDKCIQEIALGNLPDIVDLGGMNAIPAATAANLALDLKPYIDEDAEFKANIGVNYDQNLKDGHVYTVRDQLETIGFWYNEALFQKAGADVPEKWQTWADFDAAVDKLKASPDVATPFSMNQDWPTGIVLFGHMLATQEGRDFCKAAPASFDNAAFKGTLDFLGKSVLGKVDNSFFTAADSESYREDFFSGKAAMLFNGVWEAGSFSGAAVGADVIKPAVFPTDEAGKKAALVSASPGYMINANLDDVKKQACVDFVKFMLSKDTAKVIFEKVQAMPPAAIDYDSYINGEFDASVKALASACKLASKADYQAATPGAAWGEDVTSAIAGKYAGIKDGSKTTDQVVKELDSMLAE